jgi:hypothetical protein
MMTQQEPFVPLIQILVSLLSVENFVSKHTIGSFSEAMRDYDGRLLLPFVACKAPKLRAKIGGFRMAGGVSTFSQHGAQRCIAFTCVPRQSLQ